MSGDPKAFEHQVAHHDRASVTIVCQCGKVCRQQGAATMLWGSEITAYGAHLAEIRDQRETGEGKDA